MHPDGAADQLCMDPPPELERLQQPSFRIFVAQIVHHKVALDARAELLTL